MYRLTLPLTLVLALLVASVPLRGADSSEGDWPQFRGPHRNGLSSDTGLLKEWPKKGPPLLWEAKGCGRGYATPAIAKGKVFTMGDGLSIADDKDEYVVCFDAANGKLIWKAKLGPAWNSGQESWQSSRSTPTVDDDRVYTLTPQGSLVCMETETGKELWRKSMQKDFGGKKADGWGYSESVLIDGDRLICTPGGVDTAMVALNKKTGEVMWKAGWPKNRGAGHASIVIAEVGKTRVYVQSTANGPMGVKADDGTVLWKYPIDQTTAVIPTPIVRGDLVFFTAGYNRGGALLRQVPSGDGVKVEEVYPLKTALQNKHGGVILVGDYVYGDSGDSGSPFCAELMTGKVVWKGRGSGKGSASVAYADDHLYIRFADGTMALANASPTAYKEVSSFKVPGSGKRPSWSHPVIAGGKMYLREGDSILCYDVKAK
jgi:outer membrane protein assembly factor BamB